MAAKKKKHSKVQSTLPDVVKPKKPVEVVVFNNPAKRKPREDNEDGTFKGGKHARSKLKKPEKKEKGPPIFDQKQAQHMIRQLGIHGFDKKQKDEAMVDLLVELGAKRPKGKKYHIQEYQKIQKQKKEEEREREEMERRAGIKKKKNKDGDKRKRDKDDLVNFVDGQVGYYKDGVQFIKGFKK